MELDKYRELPLYQKAEEILNMVHRIIELIPKENEMLKSTGDFMMADALKLPSKIAGAEGADLYDIRMENATIIRKSERDIFVSCNHFFAEDFKETEYLDLLRDTIEEFRVLFAEWVKTLTSGITS
ncbi:hypothetical protein SAMN05660903_00653 [Salegentibacter salinarum]|uniref:hypothetical protein n=1 Tax=Salegentibacter salinarum TaxID=447422 RepID=UPI0009C88313|nr:hypothetical protein [Salegentibacter salinarum]SKB42481.1 hypothetical protein SAMN05660903_00653 [Salegentibacter salinarum]